MKKLSSIMVVCVLVVLSGCVALGLATPKTPAQDLAYAVNVHEGLARGLKNAVSTGAVSPTDAEKIESYLVQGRVGLKVARTSIDGCTENGVPVTTVQGIAPSPVSGALPTVTTLVLQTMTCSPKTTAIDQLRLVNSLLQQLSAYYTMRGIKTGQ